jgi:hypothetical protein
VQSERISLKNESIILELSLANPDTTAGGKKRFSFANAQWICVNSKRQIQKPVKMCSL